MADYLDIASEVARIEQETTFYCGSACSLMVLKKFGIDLDQKSAYAQIHDPERFKAERLYSDPEGISHFLQSRLANNSPEPMRAASYGDGASALAGIFEVISKRSFPSVVLVFGGGHWIVIDALRVVQDAADAPRRVIGAFVENPWKNSSPSLYVAYEELQSRYLTPNEYGKTWRGRIVVVGPGLSPPAPSVAWMKDVVASAWSGTRSLLGLAENQSSPVRGAVVPAPAAFRPAASPGAPAADAMPDPVALGASNMMAHGFRNIREIAGGGAAQLAPRHVIDEGGGDDFWIVPLDASDDPVSRDFVLAAISQATGRLLAVERDVAALDRLADDAIGEAVRAKFGPAHCVIAPAHYWRTSAMTPSRFDIYRKIIVNDQAWFVLRDGEIVAELPLRPEFGG